jgi:hypothetical protein
VKENDILMNLIIPASLIALTIAAIFLLNRWSKRYDASLTHEDRLEQEKEYEGIDKYS